MGYGKVTENRDYEKITNFFKFSIFLFLYGTLRAIVGIKKKGCVMAITRSEQLAPPRNEQSIACEIQSRQPDFCVDNVVIVGANATTEQKIIVKGN